MARQTAHIGAFGFSNPEWIWQPLEESAAARFFLLEAPHDEARRRLAERGIDIEERLVDAIGSETISLTVDLWDPQAVAESIAHIIQDYSLAELHANISCGPNTVTYGIALAAEYHPISPYFCRPPRGGVTVLRPNRRPMPPEPVLIVLRELATTGVSMTMATLRRSLLKHAPQAFRPRGDQKIGQMSVQSQTNQLSRLLGRMQDDDLTVRSGSVHKRHVELTEGGFALARTLGLAPRETDNRW